MLLLKKIFVVKSALKTEFPEYVKKIITFFDFQKDQKPQYKQTVSTTCPTKGFKYYIPLYIQDPLLRRGNIKKNLGL